MNVLLLFFALPIAIIIISIALQKILKNPILVSAIIFSVFLIVTFAINNINFLIATIIYTLISYITAVLVCLIYKIKYRMQNKCNCNNINTCCNEISANDVFTISSNCQNENNNELITINSVENNNCCNENNIRRNGVSAKINVIPNSNNNGRTGCVCGRYRRN